MATIYYPSGTTPYIDSWYYGDLDSFDIARTKVTGEYVVNSSKTWKFSTYMSAMLRIDYSISGKTASGTIKYLMGRRNGNFGTNGTTTVTLDGTSKSYSGYITNGSDHYKRLNSDADSVIPWKYFTTVASFSFSATCDSSGNFSKSFNVIAESDSTNMNMPSKSVSLSFSGGASKPGKPTITVTDNGDNTFSISASKGTAGSNNGTETLTGYQYSFDNETWHNGSSGRIAKYSTVYGRAWTDGQYWDSDLGTGYATVKYYHKPSSRPTPVISFDTKKPTLKSNFTISWDAGSQYGTASYNAIKGYRVRLAKGSNFMQLGSSEEYIETNSAGSISFNILDKGFDITVGDEIHATLQIWSENGKGERLYYDSSNPAESNYVTIVNMGVVWLRLGNTWVEGQVWSRDDSTWDECTGLFILDSSAWKESTT